MKRKIVVTGGAGFVGGHLVETLLERGYDVHVVDTLVAGARERCPKNAHFFKTDIRETKALASIFLGAHAVFHLAALPRVEHSIQHPHETHEVNVTGTVNVLVAAKEAGVKRVVFASSSAIYGSQETLPLHEGMPAMPLSPYALHKYVGEKYLALFHELYGLNTIALRFFNIYGPRMDPEGPYALVIGRFLKLYKEGNPLTITGDGKQTRDFVHIDDVVRALVAAMEMDTVGEGEIINIGTGQQISVNELADLFGGERVFIPARVEPRATCADISKAKKLLNWEPTIRLEEGIEKLKET